jgi:polyhydroxyalkanoate synthesis regulator phasin
MRDFYDTPGGRRLIDSTLPRIADALERIAAALEKSQSRSSLGDLAQEFVSAGESESTAFVQRLLEEIESARGGLTVRSKEDLAKLKDGRVLRKLTESGVRLEYNEDETEVDLTKQV